MRILYYSDSYAESVAGIKISLFREIERSGHTIRFCRMKGWGTQIVSGDDILKAVIEEHFDHVWFAHTWTRYTCSLQDIEKAGAFVLGFGLSDPTGWNPGRPKQYHAYASNHRETVNLVARSGQAVHWFPSCCDLTYHDLGTVDRDIDIMTFGTGRPGHADPRDYRVQVMGDVIKAFPQHRVAIYGQDWVPLPTGGIVEGDKFKRCLQRARIVLDLQQIHAPIPHRIFEAAACGAFVLTRYRDELLSLMEGAPTIGMPGMYRNTGDLIHQLTSLFKRPDQLCIAVGVLARNVRQNHSMVNRIASLFRFLEGLGVLTAPDV